MHSRTHVHPFLRSKGLLLSIIYLLSILSCQPEMSDEEIASIGRTECKRQAAFISQTGLDGNKAAYSTSEKKYKGVVLIELNTTDSPRKVYQDASWAAHGYMGSITIDDSGHAYTVPIPFVNTLDNTFSTLHRIYRIHSHTGKMELFAELPPIDSSDGVVPFGILGLYFDCHAKVLYAASVGGSTWEKNIGKIYAIRVSDRKIIDEFESEDAMGLFVCGIEGKKKLYYGLARSPDIYSVELNKKGQFQGKGKKEFTLNGLGPRGNDKARRIRMTPDGTFYIFGLDFSYNLAAQSTPPESLYQFYYNPSNSSWNFIKVVY